MLTHNRLVDNRLLIISLPGDGYGVFVALFDAYLRFDIEYGKQVLLLFVSIGGWSWANIAWLKAVYAADMVEVSAELGEDVIL